MYNLLPWLAVGHVFLKQSVKYTDHFFVSDLKIEVPVYNLPARMTGGGVPGVELRWQMTHKE